MKVVSLDNISKTYGDTTAVKDISLTLEEGELFGLLGPNGAGKTTTISLITGQTNPDGGEITVLGTDPQKDPVETRRMLGLLPERESPPSFRTPNEYFDMIGDVRNIPQPTLEQRIEEWADRLDMHSYLDTYCIDLSRGQQQSVMITQAFLDEPELVIIDEPLVNLDPIMQERMKKFFVEYQERGNTLILSTHHIGVAEEICTRVGVINHGELIADRDPRTLSDDESLLDLFVTDDGSEQTDKIVTPEHEVQ